VPVGCTHRALNFHFRFRQVHIALPSDLQDGLTPNCVDGYVAGSI
jgi:hypothetical protein